jgi:hypothetical protein
MSTDTKDLTFKLVTDENVRLQQQIRRLELEQSVRDEVIDVAKQLIGGMSTSRGDVEEFYRRLSLI